MFSFKKWVTCCWKSFENKSRDVTCVCEKFCVTYRWWFRGVSLRRGVIRLDGNCGQGFRLMGFLLHSCVDVALQVRPRRPRSLCLLFPRSYRRFSKRVVSRSGLDFPLAPGYCFLPVYAPMTIPPVTVTDWQEYQWNWNLVVASGPLLLTVRSGRGAPRSPCKSAAVID